MIKKYRKQIGLANQDVKSIRNADMLDCEKDCIRSQLCTGHAVEITQKSGVINLLIASHRIVYKSQ